MSQTAQVAPPILPQPTPDRNVNCVVALEAAFADLIATLISQGWTTEETAEALFTLASEISKAQSCVQGAPSEVIACLRLASPSALQRGKDPACKVLRQEAGSRVRATDVWAGARKI